MGTATGYKLIREFDDGTVIFTATVMNLDNNTETTTTYCINREGDAGKLVSPIEVQCISPKDIRQIFGSFSMLLQIVLSLRLNNRKSRVLS